MKKSLIALAVMVASGAAMAQSSVTLYGIADLWVGNVGNDGKGALMGDGGLSTSRLGFKGTEDLGGGLKAMFTLEQKLFLTTGATNAATFDRQANLGIGGSFGTFTFGRNWNAMDDIFGAANSGFDSALSANNVWLNSYNGAADGQIKYASPEFAGFTAAVSTQLKGNATGGKLTAFNLAYANGPIAAALGYEKDEANGDQKGTMINGSYDLGMAKLMGSYYTTNNTGGAAGLKANSFQLGADVPLSSALTLSVGFASSKFKGGQTDNGYSIAALYSLSKRTNVYAGYRGQDRKSGGTEQDLAAVGIRHTF